MQTKILDYETWEVFCDGPFIPRKRNEEYEDIPKTSCEWSESKMRKVFLNAKAMNTLFCALDKKQFHRVSSCTNAYDYEGKNQVKEIKISRYTRQYELFQMKANESVHAMYTRFTNTVKLLEH